MTTAAETVLIVDDSDELRKVWSRTLERAGYRCVTAHDGITALDQISNGPVDAVLTDLTMPRMSGVELVRQLRAHDPNLPIVVVTGNPGLESAMQSIDARVFRYLLKPLSAPDLVQSVEAALRSRSLVAGGAASHDRDPVTPAILRRALDTLWLAVQPIVVPAERRVVAYEALLRTRDPVLQNPASVLAAAEHLDMHFVVGRVVRAHAARLAATLPQGADLFVNLHACDLLDEQLYRMSEALHEHANRIVLEITERASLDTIPDAASRVADLKKLGFRIALDDMGAGYAGLTSFAVLAPTVVKIDMSLVRNVDTTPLKQTLIRSLVRLCGELDISVVAEGVETSEELKTLTALGCSQFQGYLFAKPAAPYPQVNW